MLAEVRVTSKSPSGRLYSSTSYSAESTGRLNTHVNTRTHLETKVLLNCMQDLYYSNLTNHKMNRISRREVETQGRLSAAEI